MKSPMIALLGLLAMALTSNSNELQVVSFHRLQTNERFDLSGILKLDASLRSRYQAAGDYLVINDKTAVIYDAKLTGSEVTVRPLLDLKSLGVKGEFDLEGIDRSGPNLYIVNEAQGNIIILSGPEPKDVRTLGPRIPWSTLFPAYALSSKFGLEGLAISDGRIFLAKEMAPLAIFELKEDQSTKIYPSHRLGSQTDLKFVKDQLYVLDREGRCIWKTKIPLITQETCLSFSSAMKHPELDYWTKDSRKKQQPHWGTAEALEVFEDQFIIGFDNNGQSLKSREDSRPVIAVMKLKK